MSPTQSVEEANSPPEIRGWKPGVGSPHHGAPQLDTLVCPDTGPSEDGSVRQGSPRAPSRTSPPPPGPTLAQQGQGRLDSSPTLPPAAAEGPASGHN